jgi:hypothetical protein
MTTWRLREIGRDISRSQDSQECDASKHGSNPDSSVNPTPEMPLKRHLLTLHVVMSVWQFWLSAFCYLQSREDAVLRSLSDG